MGFRRTHFFGLALLLAVAAAASPGCNGDGSNTSTTSGMGGAGGDTTSSSATGSSTDDDGDGFSEDDGDCDDTNDLVNPDADEACADGVDNNCNGAADQNEPDGDGDGFGPCAGDCNDGDATINPAADEIALDGLDNNCDGVIDADFDSDGFTEVDGDCDDDDPLVYPGAPELCHDGVDNDCNSFADADEPDGDGDGFGPCAGDCDDTDPNVGPNQPEIDGDGIDNDCDNLVDLDVDADGFTTTNGDCNDNDPAINPAAIEDCDDGIDNNCNSVTDTDCLTPCELAALQRSSVGCVYYAVDTNPLQSSQKAIAVSNIDPTTSANVVVEVKNNGVWAPISGGTVTVAPLALTTVNIPHRNITGTAIRAGGAYRVTSDLPVIAYQFNPINGASSFLSDASLLLPKSSLDNFYITPGWPYGRDIGSTLRPTHIQIAATEDNTTVLVTSATTSTPGQSVPTFQQGVQSSVVLQEGDFLQVTVQNENGSFAGSYVEADKPVSVFTSNDCANVPFGAANCCCEHLEENIFGLQTWGTSYVGARAPQRLAEQVVWQVTAQENNTTITFDAHASVTGLPPGNTDTLMAGETKEYSINGPAANPGDFIVTGDKPILLTQYTVGSFAVQSNGTNGDPSQVQAVPVEQFLDRYVVLVPSTWVNDYVVLVRETGQTVNLDGNPVTAGWVAVGGSNYQAARVSVADGVHVLDGAAPFGVMVVGWDTYDSYAYPGGLNQKLINPIN